MFQAGNERWFLHIGQRAFYARCPWFSVDIGSGHPPLWKPRACAACGREHGDGFPDPCIGFLESVRGSCCGHGDRARSYIGFDSGLTIRGFWIDEESRQATEEYQQRMLEATPEHIPVTIQVSPLVDVESLTDEDLVAMGKFVFEAAGFYDEAA
jgi:hypothetical protein